MAWGLLETPDKTVMIALHTKHSPSQAEWESWCEFLKQHGQAAHWDLSRFVNLVVTDGGAPSLAQRTNVNNIVAQGKTLPLVAVVTDAYAVRLIARAFTIFNPKFRVFAPEDFGAALSYLGISSFQRELVAILRRMETTEFGLGSVQTLKQLRRVEP